MKIFLPGLVLIYICTLSCTLGIARPQLPHATSTKYGSRLASNRGCPAVACDKKQIGCWSESVPVKLAFFFSVCSTERLQHIWAGLSCSEHDVFIALKCGGYAHVPDVLKTCTKVLDWSWCSAGKSHCSNIHFVLAFYHTLQLWKTVVFLKDVYFGKIWNASWLSVISQRLLKENILYENFSTKSKHWNYKSRAGRHWLPVLKRMSCGIKLPPTTIFAAGRSNFAVATSAILMWPACKYQWLFHLLHYPPKGAVCC
uniref:Secreted protein n=1 Tax=Tetraselmis sp. GSL018 TaxID=582737 RepID=A0A061S383_9CHLO